MNAELLAEFSTRYRSFAFVAICAGCFLLVLGVGSYIYFFAKIYFFTGSEPKFKPSDVQAGSLLASGLLLMLACFSPWIREKTLNEEVELALSEQAQSYADQIESLKNDLRSTKSANLVSKPNPDLDRILTAFFQEWSRYGFNVARLKKWGAGKEGFEELKNFKDSEIGDSLNRLVAQEVVRTRLSRRGSVLYQIKNTG